MILKLPEQFISLRFKCLYIRDWYFVGLHLILVGKSTPLCSPAQVANCSPDYGSVAAHCAKLPPVDFQEKANDLMQRN